MGQYDTEIRQALLDALTVTRRDADGHPMTVAGDLPEAVRLIGDLIYDLTTDHRYRAEEFWNGWKFFSPAARWETVTRVDDGGEYSVRTRVWTEETGPDYSWRFYNEEKFDAVPPRAERFPVVPEVRIVDLPTSMIAVVTARHIEVPNMRMVLASAKHLGKGKGWQVLDWPGDSDEMVTTEHRSKAAARSALRAAAKVHAKALVLPVREENGRG